MYSPIKIMLISQYAIIRHGLRSLLSSDTIEVVADALPDEAALALAQTFEPHIVLIDIPMPDTYGLAFTKKLQQLHISCKVVFLTQSYNEGDMRAAMAAQVAGYVLKTIDAERLISTLHMVAEGGTVFPHSALKVRQQPEVIPLMNTLTNREQQILCCLARGLPNKTIARELTLAEGTVKVHIKAILRKLELANRTQAAVFMLQQNTDTLPA